MTQPLLVVARNTSNLSRIPQGSLLCALNIRDFLEQTGEFDTVTIFQLRSVDGAMKEWVALSETEC
ncbi:MAG: hypothetical protein ABSA72_10485 [Nitrososphaerales archaeon]|jgi:hypothetical protein